MEGNSEIEGGNKTVRLSISDYTEFSPDNLPPQAWFRPYVEKEPMWAVYVPHDAWVFETFPKRPGYWRQYTGPFYLCKFPNGRITAISEKVMVSHYRMYEGGSGDIEEVKSDDGLRFGMAHRKAN